MEPAHAMNSTNITRYALSYMAKEPSNYHCTPATPATEPAETPALSSDRELVR